MKCGVYKQYLKSKVLRESTKMQRSRAKQTSTKMTYAL